MGRLRRTAAFTQNPVQVTVQTNPAGLSFTVDGTTYTSAQTFSWQPGSSHTIATTSPQSGGTGVRYVWTNWSWRRSYLSHCCAYYKQDLHSELQHSIFSHDEPWNWWHSDSTLVAGKTADELFQLGPRQLPVTVSPIGLGAEQAPFQARPIRLQSQWAAPSRRQLLLLIIESH